MPDCQANRKLSSSGRSVTISRLVGNPALGIGLDGSRASRKLFGVTISVEEVSDRRIRGDKSPNVAVFPDLQENRFSVVRCEAKVSAT